MHKISAVVVTYNRQELLVASLSALEAQSRPVDRILVVDNASTDDTANIVKQKFPGVEFHQLNQNTGGAGGFAAGLALALADDADSVWLLDDDTIPRPDALLALLNARDRYQREPVGLLASRVIWTDGRDHPMNTPRRRPGATRDQIAAASAVGCIPIRSASFVSVLADANLARQVGLPEADFFLWNDDFEFTTRLLKDSVGLYCPRSVVEHHTKKFGATDQDPGERFFFEVRNKTWTFLRSDGLTVPEKALYGASTVARWGRTFLHSSDRSVLRRNLVRGMREGIQSRPRDTEEILHSAGLDSHAVQGWRE